MEVTNIVIGLSMIEEDDTVPRNIRQRIKETRLLLVPDCDDIAIDKSLEELELVVDDPNVPQYTRAQIMTVVSMLENQLRL